MIDSDETTVRAILSRALDAPAFERARAAARDIAAAHGDSVVAIVFYGSCRRQDSDDGKILDFYVLVDRYRTAHRGAGQAFANWLLPPTVFYRETPHTDGPVRTKYNILSLKDFHRMSHRSYGEVMVWARFSQPFTLIHARDTLARHEVLQGAERAVLSITGSTAPLMKTAFTARDLWQEAFRRTYGAELRAESAADKPAELFDQYPDHYRALTEPALKLGGFAPVSAGEKDGAPAWRVSVPAWRPAAARLAWRRRRILGKTKHVLRLIKGAFTFDGGIDYLAWKIRRHSGVEIEITPWQRRHPILAGLSLFLRLRRQGAFR